MIAALLLVLQPAPTGAAQPAAPSRRQEAVGQFASACFDGALRTRAPYREIPPAEAPRALRNRYRDGFSARYFRIGADRPSYLVLVSATASSAAFTRVCGLAVPGMRLGTLFDRAIESLTGERRAAVMDSASAATFSNPDDGYVVSGEIVGGYALLEVSHYRDPGKLPVR